MYRRQTESLYWKRFPYKVVLNLPFAYYLRNYNDEEIDKIVKSDKPEKFMNNMTYNSIKKNHRELLDLRGILNKFDEQDYRFRTEGSSISVFFKDMSLFDAVNSRFGKDIIALYEPLNADVLQTILENRVIVKRNLTHDCRYKIRLREDGLKNLTDSSKKSLVRMLSTDRFANTNRLIDDIQNRKYIWTQFIYAKESKDLLMFQMVGHDMIGEVIKMVTYDELEKEKANAD